MVAGTTSTGFDFNVNEKVVEDWRFMTAIADSGSKDELKMLQGTTQMARLLFDEKDMNRLMDHVKREDGIVPSAEMQKEILEVFQAINGNSESKN